MRAKLSAARLGEKHTLQFAAKTRVAPAPFSRFRVLMAFFPFSHRSAFSTIQGPTLFQKHTGSYYNTEANIYLGTLAQGKIPTIPVSKIPKVTRLPVVRHRNSLGYGISLL